MGIRFVSLRKVVRKVKSLRKAVHIEENSSWGIPISPEELLRRQENNEPVSPCPRGPKYRVGNNVVLDSEDMRRTPQ